jgi:pilus assembly protein CpaB
MNTRAFSLALTIAALAMFMVYTYVEDKETKLTEAYGVLETVLVAKRDIKALELLDDTKVQARAVPKKFVNPGYFNEMKAIENTIATVPIMKGEQISKPRVTYPGAKTGLSRQVSVGKRAFAIGISARQAVSKLIKPGDRVDVLAALDYTSGRKDRQRTKTILQDVIVLSTGKSMTNAIPIYGVKTPTEIRKMNANVYEKYNTVTLELDPYQVQKLIYILVYSGNKPFLALRNNNDKKIVRIKSTDIFDVLGEDERAEAKGYFNSLLKRKSQ